MTHEFAHPQPAFTLPEYDAAHAPAATPPATDGTAPPMRPRLGLPVFQIGERSAPFTSPAQGPGHGPATLPRPAAAFAPRLDARIAPGAPRPSVFAAATPLTSTARPLNAYVQSSLEGHAPAATPQPMRAPERPRVQLDPHPPAYAQMTNTQPPVYAPAPRYAQATLRAPAAQYAPATQYAPAPPTRHAAGPEASPHAWAHLAQNVAHSPAADPAPAQRSAPSGSFYAGGGGAVALATDRSAKFVLTPVHVGIAMTMMVMLVIIANTPGGSMKTMGPQSLPGPTTLVPGQQSAAMGDSSSVVAGGAVSGAGAQVLPLRQKPRGMMSPAAATSIEFEREGKVPTDSSEPIPMKGIPSPAAAATMQPQELPLKASDGMTLPRDPSQRDAAPVEQHYGDNPGMQHSVVPTRPAMTPAEAEEMAQNTAAAPVNHPYGNEAADSTFTMPNSVQ